jgi:catechol 2,3-dioxygenase-like lactoylglutathione lyase family enzyme
MVSSTKPRAIGFNHVALEVGDIEEALEFRTAPRLRRGVSM